MSSEPSESMIEDADLPRDFVGSVAHGMAVLACFDRHHAQMTLSEVSERTAMSRAGARRYLLTLAHLGYIEQNGRLFRLTPKILELGYAFMSTMPLAEIAQPYLDRIARQTDETCAIAILDDFHVVHLASATTRRQLAPTVTIGRRFSALHNSTGRVLLACMDEAAREAFLADVKIDKPTQWSISTAAKLREELDRVRKQGYAIVDQEAEPGLRSAAVPIVNKRGEAIAALNVITNIAAVSAEHLQNDLLPVIQKVGAEISAAIVTA